MKVLCTLCLCALLSACGSLQVVQKPGATIKKNSSFAVVSMKNDNIGVQGQLEHYLMSKGFDLKSPTSAKDNYSHEDEVGAPSDGSPYQEGDVSRGVARNADYTLRITYSAYYDAFYWALHNFSGSIVDNKDGSVVLSADFSGDRSVKSVLKEFTARIEGATE